MGQPVEVEIELSITAARRSLTTLERRVGISALAHLLKPLPGPNYFRHQFLNSCLDGRDVLRVRCGTAHLHQISGPSFPTAEAVGPECIVALILVSGKGVNV